MADPTPGRNATELRGFPRIETRCPILYLCESDTRWQVGIMDNMSAVGFQMTCKEGLAGTTKLEFKYQPGSNRLVPPMGGTAVVVRCEPTEQGEFSVACKLTRVVPSK